MVTQVASRLASGLAKFPTGGKRRIHFWEMSKQDGLGFDITNRSQ